MSYKRRIYGLPSVGGKSQLAPYLCEVIEQCAKDCNLNTYISGCGGGGKDIFSLKDGIFDRYIYNEIEVPVAKLVEALTSRTNVDDVSCEMERIIEQALKVDVAVDDAEKKQEIQLRAMFQSIYDLFADGNKEQVEKKSLIELAAYGAILIYGSVQNNRKSIFYKSNDGKRSFYKDMYKKFKHYENLCDVSNHAYGVEVINGDCFDIIEKYKNDEKAFIYIDPPYWNCSNDYTNTFDFKDHIKLINLCKDAKCKIMISMHRFGIAPYFLKLYFAKGWYSYVTPEISHSTRSGKVNNTMRAHLKAVFDEYTEIIECDVFIPKESIDNKSIEEYIFTNFKVDDDCFSPFCIDDEFVPELDEGIKFDFSIGKYEEVDNPEFTAIFEFAVYSLYMEIMNKTKKERKQSNITKRINSEDKQSFYEYVLENLTCDAELDIKETKKMLIYIQDIIESFNECFKKKSKIKRELDKQDKEKDKEKEKHQPRQQTSVKKLYPNEWKKTLEKMYNIFGKDLK